MLCSLKKDSQLTHEVVKQEKTNKMCLAILHHGNYHKDEIIDERYEKLYISDIIRPCSEEGFIEELYCKIMNKFKYG